MAIDLRSTHFLSRHGFDVDALETSLRLGSTQNNGSAPVAREALVEISREAD
jgi:hypothetical protein